MENVRLAELVILFVAVAAVVTWLATIGVIALHKHLTPGQRVGWLIAVTLTHVLGAAVFLTWDRMRVRPAPRATLNGDG